MALDFEGLMYLMRSDCRENAAVVIRAWAERTGFGQELNSALERSLRETGEHNGRASPEATEHVLRDAFWRLETMGRVRPPSGYARFVERVNLMAGLAQKLDAAVGAAIGLLYTPTADGRAALPDGRARAHVEDVLALLDWMGTRHLTEPDQWGDLIENAHRDLVPLNGIVFDDPPDFVHELLLNTLSRMQEHRSEEMTDRLRAMPVQIEAAYNEKRYEHLRALAVETWVEVIERLRYYDDVHERRALESRRRFKVVSSVRGAGVRENLKEGACVRRGQPCCSPEAGASAERVCTNLVGSAAVAMLPPAASVSIAFASGALALFPCSPLA